MKRYIMLVICLLSLIIILPACNRRQEYTHYEETTIPVVTGEGGDSEESETTINNEFPYSNISSGDLLSLYNEYKSIYVEPNISAINTPYYIIISAKNGGAAYSKANAEIVPLCKDPLCNHKNCIYKDYVTIVDYEVSDDRIYLLVNSFYRYELYSFDFWMNDIKKVADWEIEDLPTCLHYYEGQIYYQAFYLHEKEPILTTFMLNTDNGDKTLLWGTERFDAIVGGYENRLYYKSHGSIYSYDLLTKKDNCIVPASTLDVQKGEISLNFRWANDKVISYSTYSTIYGTQNYEFNFETGECNICIKQNDSQNSNVIRFGDYYYFFVRHDTPDYKEHEHYNYFIKQSEEFFGKANMSGGEIWRCPISGGKAELVASMTTDGIPDNIQYLYTYDGKYLVVRYESYMDYQNEYNSSFNPFAHDYVQCFRFALIDVESGNVFTFETKGIY